MSLQFKDVLYLPSGRIFIQETANGYIIESTEMRDVAVDGKLHAEVRETQNPQEIWKHLVPYRQKWLLTVSTQMGCTHSCKFCDVANLPFKGNLSQSEIEDQIVNIIKATPYVLQSNKVKIGFARMGEPAYNVDNVLSAMKNLPEISGSMGKDFKWLPCFNTILPQRANVLAEVIEFKESVYNGRLHLQISCNSTDEETRWTLFNGADVVTLNEILAIVNKHKITNRTVTLNFIVMKDIEVSVDKLKKLGLNGDKFTVKLIPLNATKNAEENSLMPFANYSNYEDLIKLGEEFKSVGVPVVVDAIAKCEEAGLCCGQLAQIYL
jgi:adenine C2-methylase RlmN of 23S rRNA A2503 and tRNA A37